MHLACGRVASPTSDSLDFVVEDTVTKGFATSVGGRVVRDQWVELSPMGSADLLVGDVGHDRVIWVR